MSVPAQTGPVLEIRRVGASEATADVVRFFHAAVPGSESYALFADKAGERRLVRTRVRAHDAGVLWIADAYSVAAGQLQRALDRGLFSADTEGFAELGRQTELGGPKLHRQPIRLPRVMTLGAWHSPLVGLPGRVRLEFAGAVALQLGELLLNVRALCLVAQEGEHVREQWLAEGLGEVALGDHGQPFMRWLVGHVASGGERTLEGVPESLQQGPWPRLPSQAGVAARDSSLF